MQKSFSKTVINMHSDKTSSRELAVSAHTGKYMQVHRMTECEGTRIRGHKGEETNPTAKKDKQIMIANCFLRSICTQNGDTFRLWRFFTVS